MGSSISTMVRSSLLTLLLLGLLVNTCLGCKVRMPQMCKDKLSSEKCTEILDNDQCDTNAGKKCMKTCELCDSGSGGSGSGESGEGGKCKDKLPAKKCKKILKDDQCDSKAGKKCMKTCDLCGDEGPKKSPFELIDSNADGNITRDELEDKLNMVMDKVSYITNVTLDLNYDDIWNMLDCNNDTMINMEDWEMLMDGEDQCGNELDSWFYFAFNIVVSLMQMLYSKM